MRLELEGKLEVAVFLRRLNRFMAEVALNNTRVLAHLPNSGRLVTVLVSKATAFLKNIVGLDARAATTFSRLSIQVFP